MRTPQHDRVAADAAPMRTKVLIVSGFHRFVGSPERKEVFPAGKTVEASQEDAAAWIAAGLAKAA